MQNLKSYIKLFSQTGILDQFENIFLTSSSRQFINVLIFKEQKVRQLCIIWCGNSYFITVPVTGGQHVVSCKVREKSLFEVTAQDNFDHLPTIRLYSKSGQKRKPVQYFWNLVIIHIIVTFPMIVLYILNVTIYKYVVEGQTCRRTKDADSKKIGCCS